MLSNPPPGHIDLISEAKYANSFDPVVGVRGGGGGGFC